jgi:hypothetical protein
VWFSRYYAYNEQNYHDLLAQFRANQVPIDTLSVDTDFKHENNPLFAPAASLAVGGTATQGYSWNGWEWNTNMFPVPQRFLDWAHSQGLSVTVNIHPSISSDDPQWQATQARSARRLLRPPRTARARRRRLLLVRLVLRSLPRAGSRPDRGHVPQLAVRAAGGGARPALARVLTDRRLLPRVRHRRRRQRQRRWRVRGAPLHDPLHRRHVRDLDDARVRGAVHRR